MNEQTDSNSTSDQSETPEHNPLWLPRGSVRALIALGVVGVWVALETGVGGLEPSDAVRSIAVAIAAGYGLLRSRDQGNEAGPRSSRGTEAGPRSSRGTEASPQSSRGTEAGPRSSRGNEAGSRSSRGTGGGE